MAANGKAGVGLIVDAGEPVAGRDLMITTEDPGWSGEIYGAAEGPPEDLAGWGEPIGTFDDVGGRDDRRALNTNESRYYLIWITTLTENPDGGLLRHDLATWRSAPEPR